MTQLQQSEMCSRYILWCICPTDGSWSNLQDANLPVAVPSPSSTDQPELPMQVRPMNYVRLTRDFISGTFVVDPTLKVPRPLMPSLASGGIQWNLHLFSKSIADVEIHLVDGGSVRPRTMLSVQSMNDVRVKLVCFHPL